MQTEIIAAMLIAGAAIFGALVAWLGHRVLRENSRLSAEISRSNAELQASIERENFLTLSRIEAAKILSASRQNWINDLRHEMVAFVEACAVPSDGDTVRKMSKRTAMIELHLNPKSDEYGKLFDAMNACVAASKSEHPKKLEHLGDAVGTYTLECRHILKNEWDVLKDEVRNVASNAQP